MNIVGAITCFLAAVVALASPAGAFENQASFSRRVAKYATTDPSRPKGLCWCKDGFGGAGEGEAGYVVQQVTSGQVLVMCKIPEFNSGNFVSFVTCAVEWDMLGK